MRANALKLAVALLSVSFALALPARAFETKPYDAAAFKAAQDAGAPILVDVFAPWCPTCKAQQQVLDKLKANPDLDKITVFKVDYDNQPEAVQSFNARMQSTLIAYKGTTETGRSAGDTNAKSIEALMKTALE
jgi:thiol-disulfide isomerase/thioredoxin